MLRTFNFHQQREQAGFRSGYSTVYHLQAVNKVQEKANVYNIPLNFAFVEYEKAFDSIDFESLFEALRDQDVDEAYLKIMRNIYSETASVLRLYKGTKKPNLEGETEKEIASLPNCLCNICNTSSSSRSTGITKVSGLTVITYYPVLCLQMIYSSWVTVPRSGRKRAKISMTLGSR